MKNKIHLLSVIFCNNFELYSANRKLIDIKKTKRRKTDEIKQKNFISRSGRCDGSIACTVKCRSCVKNGCGIWKDECKELLL